MATWKEEYPREESLDYQKHHMISNHPTIPFGTCVIDVGNSAHLQRGFDIHSSIRQHSFVVPKDQIILVLSIIDGKKVQINLF